MRYAALFAATFVLFALGLITGCGGSGSTGDTSGDTASISVSVGSRTTSATVTIPATTVEGTVSTPLGTVAGTVTEGGTTVVTTVTTP